MNDQPQSRTTGLLDRSATILLIVVALLVGGITIRDRVAPPRTAGTRAPRPEPPVPSAPLAIGSAPTRGDKNAKLALILFSEFECPYCAKTTREVLPLLDREYLRTGKALLVWKHYPLTTHAFARKAAEASECANRQGRFWAFHDWAFQHQKELSEANILAQAKSLSLDTAAFGRCLSGEAAAMVEADITLGDAISLAGTPLWIIGAIQPDGHVKASHRLNGAKPYVDIQEILDKLAAPIQAQKVSQN